MHYHPGIRQAPVALPSPSTPTPESSEQPLTAQALLPPPVASKGSCHAGDQVHGVEVAKDKGKGKETKPPSEAKNAAKAEDATVKAKEAETRSKEADPKAKDALTSQPSKKEDPAPPKIKA